MKKGARPRDHIQGTHKGRSSWKEETNLPARHRRKWGEKERQIDAFQNAEAGHATEIIVRSRQLPERKGEGAKEGGKLRATWSPSGGGGGKKSERSLPSRGESDAHANGKKKNSWSSGGKKRREGGAGK